MAQKIEVYGVPPGEKQDEWLLALYVNPKVVIGSTPAKECIIGLMESRGCLVSSIRKRETPEHEML